MMVMRGLTSHLPRPATVIAVIALCLTAGASATAATLITGKQIKDNTITGADVRRGSLPAKDLSRAARRTLQGTAGPRGATGPAGPPGADGTGIPARLVSAQATGVKVDSDDGPVTIREIVLPTGLYALDAVLMVKSDGSGDVCRLETSGGLLHEVEFEVDDVKGEQLVLQGEFDNSSRPSGRVRVTCSADDRLEADVRIRATQVSQLG